MLVECPIVVLVLVLVNHGTTPYAAELGAQTETRCEPLTYAYREAIMPELQNIGFELTPTAEGDYSITAVPSGLDGLDYTALLQDLVASAREKTTSAIDDINHSIALELARNAAVAYGQVLTNAEMENIVNSLFTCSNFSYTPDGKKILTMLHQNELEHLFGT